MKQVLEAAKEIQDFINTNGWDFCFIGGVALQRWAVPRSTVDVDLTLLTGVGSEQEYVIPLLNKFESRITDDPLDFFLSRRIVLVKIGNVGIDISLGALTFEELAVRRASYYEFLPGTSLRTCSAEDLVVFKAFANRLKDWADIESILSVRQTLDWTYINKHLSLLVELKEEPEILATLEDLRKKTINK